jgi:hypothetical protein
MEFPGVDPRQPITIAAVMNCGCCTRRASSPSSPRSVRSIAA